MREGTIDSASAKYRFCPSPPFPQDIRHLVKDTGKEGCQTCQDPGGHEVQPPNFEDGENEVQRREEMTLDHTVNQNPCSFSRLPLLIY